MSTEFIIGTIIGIVGVDYNVPFFCSILEKKLTL